MNRIDAISFITVIITATTMGKIFGPYKQETRQMKNEAIVVRDLS